MSDKVTITEDFLDKGKSDRGSWSKAQMELLGEKYPLRSGWKERLIGQEITSEIAEQFVGLKNKHLQKKSLSQPVKAKEEDAIASPLPPPKPKLKSNHLSPVKPKSEENSTLKEVIIYTDGACLGNPGVGGWGAILKYGEHCKEISGGEPELTTNNRMEMMAAIEALNALKYPCRVRLHSDSQLLINTLTLNWKRKANQDLWEELDRLNQIHQVEWIWVKGHASDPLNNQVDRLAVTAAKQAAKSNE